MEWGLGSLGYGEAAAMGKQSHPILSCPILSPEKPPLTRHVPLNQEQLSHGSSSTFPVHTLQFPASLASSLRNNPFAHMAEPGGVGLAGLSHA